MSLLQLYDDLEFPSKKWDSYFDAYESLLSKYVGKAPRVLEIGIQQGGSLELWARYFDDGIVYGIDIDPNCKNHNYKQKNIIVETGDQGDVNFWNEFFKDKEPFDIIIDDGSHVNHHQITTLVTLFPHLKVGGTYIIEDTHTSYWNEYGGGFKKQGSCVELCKDLIDFLHQQHIRDATPPKIMNDIFVDLNSLLFYNSMVVLQKTERGSKSVPFENIAHKIKEN